MKRLTTAIVGLAAAGLVLSSVPAQAGSDTIKVGVGISGVKVGHKKKTVVRKLGQPLHVQKGRNDDGPYQVLTYPHALSVTPMRSRNARNRSPNAVCGPLAGSNGGFMSLGVIAALLRIRCRIGKGHLGACRRK